MNINLRLSVLIVMLTAAIGVLHYQHGPAIYVLSSRSNLAAVSGAGSGLIAQYAFEGNANDSAGGNNGTIIGAPATVAGHNGIALSFNGTTDKILVNSSFSNLSNISTSFWLKADNTNNSGQIVGNVNSNTLGWKVVVGANNIQFTVDYDGTDLDVRSSTGSLDTSWAHWVVTWNGSMSASGVHIYKNGVEVAYAVQRDAVGNRVSDTGRNLSIGNNGLGNRGLVGTLDDLYIYSSVLSSSDISELSGVSAGSGGNQNVPVQNPPANNPPTNQGDVISPGVSLTSPTASQSVSGTMTITANASDNVGVVGVQFLVDGANIGNEDVSAPYSVSWNSTSVSNGSHTISARARDAAGNTQSAAVPVTVANQSQANQIQSAHTPKPAPVSWTAPIGIPDPVTTFGAFDPIRGTHFMYQLDPGQTCSTNPGKCFNFGSGLEEYRDNGNGPYTHYVDNTFPACSTGQNSGCSTDTNNPFGTHIKPRMTIPSNVPAGSVIEVHGGPYSPGSSWFNMSGTGTANAPIFYRGINVKVFDRYPRVIGSYLVIEGFEFYGDKGAINIYGDGNHHISIRKNYIHDQQPSSGGSAIGVHSGQDIVVYDNIVFNNGSPDCPGHPRCGLENDIHGIHSALGSARVWIVDNNVSNNGGDSVQVNGGISEPYPDYIYIGRNTLHEEGENAVDIKTAKHVVISQNNMYGFGPTNFANSGSDGTAVVINDDNYINRLDNSVWVIFNNIHHATNGIRTQAYAKVIGNVIHDVSNTGIVSFGGHDIHIENNTLYNMPNGIDRSGGAAEFKLTAYNNILANISDIPFSLNNAYLNSLVQKNDFYPSSKIKWRGATLANLAAFVAAQPTQCAGCIAVDPAVIDGSSKPYAQTGDYRLTANSQVKNAAVPTAIYDQYYATFGVDIRKDFNGIDRPQEGAWDMGAFEYYSGQPAVNPVPQAPVTPQQPAPQAPADADNDGVADISDLCANTPSNIVRAAINRYGCIKPAMNNFDIRPDLDLDIRALTNVELGRATIGKITWSQAVALARANAQMDVDANVQISAKKIVVNSTALPELNRPATLTFYGVTETNPQIMKDGVACVSCQVTSFANQILTVVVPGFSTYEVSEGVIPTVVNPGAAIPASAPTPVPQVPGGGGGSGGSFVAGGIAVTAANVQGQSQAQASVPGCLTGNIFSTITGQRCPTIAASGAAASTPTGLSAYAFSQNLNVGSRGVEVQMLQKFLNMHGYPVAASGAGSMGNESMYFGPATANALKRFQAANGLVADGSFGPRTRAKVNESAPASGYVSSVVPSTAAMPSTASAPAVSGGISLRIGSSGEAVKALRQKLRAAGYFAPYGSGAEVPASAAAETSNFGATTEAAVKRFQCDKGIVCSGSAATTGWGSVGARTRAALGI